MVRYRWVAYLGLGLAMTSFLATLFGARARATYLAADKVTRETAAAGSSLIDANARAESISAWTPAIAFLGLGLLLVAIVMALGLIHNNLRESGAVVMARWPSRLNFGVPSESLVAWLFPLTALIGLLALLAASVWAFSLIPSVTSYWNHSITYELEPAKPGSVLLDQLGRIQGTLYWIALLRFLGLGLLFASIAMALVLVIRTLQFQEVALLVFLKTRLR